MSTWIRCFVGAAGLGLLAACGGGGGDDAGGSAALTDAQRTTAAQSTAQANAACSAVQPFYWEIGRSAGRLAGGSVGAGAPLRDTQMPIASASKMLYAGYVAERRAGVLTAEDIRYLSFRSGYSRFDSCAQNDTVGSCASSGNNGGYVAANDGKFFYGGGHMQQHAAQPALMGLGALDNAGLAAELRARLDNDIVLAYSQPQPQPAGGVRSSAADYALFLQRVLAGSLKLRDLLGTSAVHTNPVLFPAEAVSTPIALTESWSYSIGHWVETDPVVGDGAFSSAGAFGFYPWIDAGKTTYGVLARVALGVAGEGAGAQSAACGRLIRKAWLSGQAVP